MCYLSRTQLPAKCKGFHPFIRRVTDEWLQVLGRASELNSFVKIGTENGHIEIELKGAKGKPNLVIRRDLNARSKSNQFFINGKQASGKEINARMQELNVQVSNLW